MCIALRGWILDEMGEKGSHYISIFPLKERDSLCVQPVELSVHRSGLFKSGSRVVQDWFRDRAMVNLCCHEKKHREHM